MIEVKRLEILKQLESAAVAITSKPLIEQSDTFVFKEGRLITFDGEICTRQKSPFGDKIEGSILAADFLKILQRFPDDILMITKRSGKLIIKGKRRSAGLTMMTEVLLPYSNIPEPEKYRKVPEGLQNNLTQASHVCRKNDNQLRCSHIHVAKNYVEATDGFRLFRADIKTGLIQSILVPAINLLAACKFEITKMAADDFGWLHFVTNDKMCISLLCAEDTYFDKKELDKILNKTGEEVILPSNLPEILARAEVMDGQDFLISNWSSHVTISLSANLLRVTNRKDEGWFREVRKCKYDGPEMTFSIHPTFLKDLFKRTRKAIINDNQIKIKVDNIHFTAILETKEKEE